ncbi:DUF6893 family small protein [Kitasatospora camelliae]
MLKVLFGGALGALFAAVVWQTLPDLRRYLRILRM